MGGAHGWTAWRCCMVHAVDWGSQNHTPPLLLSPPLPPSPDRPRARHDGLPLRRVHAYGHGLRHGGAGEARAEVPRRAQGRQGQSGARAGARTSKRQSGRGAREDPRFGSKSVCCPAFSLPLSLLHPLSPSPSSSLFHPSLPPSKRTRASSACRAATRARTPTTASASASPSTSATSSRRATATCGGASARWAFSCVFVYVCVYVCVCVCLWVFVCVCVAGVCVGGCVCVLVCVPM